MGPTRTTAAAYSDGVPGPSTPSRKWRGKRKAHEGPSSASLPSVQKLKASLRQARRLLMKENLAADVRVETERRIKALEVECANAEVARKERSIAVRYHKVKFFERQKVVRKINQTLRKIVDSSNEAERTSLEEISFELRVDLNYILHYPKTQKYISLFPPATEHAQAAQTKDSSLSVPSQSDEQRNQLKTWIRDQMRSGTISLEPEKQLKSLSNEHPRQRPAKQIVEHADVDKGEDVRKSRKFKKITTRAVEFGSDPFFGNDSDSGGEEKTDENDMASSEDDSL